MKTKCVFLSLIWCASSLCFADGFGSPKSELQVGLSAMQDETSNKYSGQAASDSMTYHLNFKLGYVFSNGFYFGGLYDSTNFYANATGTPSPDIRHSLGPTLGYEMNSFFLFATYFLSSKMTLGSGGVFTGGSNYEIEFGYNWMVNSTLYLGISLIYETFSWNSSVSGGVTTAETNSQANFYPAIGFGATY